MLRFDAYKRSQLSEIVTQSISLPSSASACPLLGAEAKSSDDMPINNSTSLNSTHWNRLTYFHCSLIGYLIGLITATVSSEIFKAAQPALLYLVPFTLLPLLTMAYLKVSYIN